jgi:hypothetical protein
VGRDGHPGRAVGQGVGRRRGRAASTIASTASGVSIEASGAPHLDAHELVAQLAFELYACLEMTNYQFVLFRDAAFIERGRRAVDRLLEPPPA